jgi:hypothetical protein
MSCQQKHKVFLWLLRQDRLNTRGLLKRKNMLLESYTCELCLLQREEILRVPLQKIVGFRLEFRFQHGWGHIEQSDVSKGA